MRRTLVEAALELAASGVPVFPCMPRSKKPATHRSFKDASTNESLIRRWWSQSPDANLAIPTGAASYDVLDVDMLGGAGFPAFQCLKRAGLLTEAAALVSTPNNGLHAYYAGTSARCSRLPQHHLDFKATGGYVLVPPSEVDGRPYEWLKRDRPDRG